MAIAVPTSTKPAAWKGIPFEALEIGFTSGRRLTVTEYPQRDEPLVEDQGRKARRWKLRGFVVGPTAPILERRLVATLSEDTPGPLLHPTLGIVTARLETLDTRKGADGVNVVQFDLGFVEAGSWWTLATIQTVAAVTQATATRAAAVAMAANLSHANHPQAAGIRASRASTVAQALGAVADGFASQEAAQPFQEAIAEIVTNSRVLGLNPGGLVEAFQGAFALVTDPVDLRALASTLAEPSTGAVEASQALLEAGSSSAVALEALEDQALQDLALAASCLANAGEASAGAVYRTWDDAMAVQQELADQAAGVALHLQDADAYGALMDLRGAVVQAITEEAVALPRLRDLLVARPRPALALAFDLYGDANRAAEIVERNGLADPLQAYGALRVLTA